MFYGLMMVRVGTRRATIQIQEWGCGITPQLLTAAPSNAIVIDLFDVFIRHGSILSKHITLSLVLGMGVKRV